MAISSTEQSVVGMLRLAMRGGYRPEAITEAANRIRQLPDVVRVRADAAGGRVEIMFRHPAPGLLQRVHLALKLASQEVMAGESW